MAHTDIAVRLMEADTEKSAWNAYIERQGGSFYHQWQWKSLIEKLFGHRCYYFAALDDDAQIVGVLPVVNLKSLLFGNYMVSMPYFNYGSVLANSDEIANKLLEAAIEQGKANKVSHIQFRDLSPRSYFPEANTSTGKVNMVLELPESAEALGKAIGSKRRSQIKRPLREGVVSKFGHAELLDDFYYVFSHNMRDLGTPVYSKKFFAEILQTFGEAITIAVVYWQDKPVGTGFLVRHGDQMEIPWASTMRYANRISVNMFLYWEILKNAIETGCKTFDFGRSSPDAGTYKFKKQWGAEPVQLYWHHWVPEGCDVPDLSPKNAKFDLAIKVWQKLPLKVTTLIGPPLVKNLP